MFQAKLNDLFKDTNFNIKGCLNSDYAKIAQRIKDNNDEFGVYDIISSTITVEEPKDFIKVY